MIKSLAPWAETPHRLWSLWDMLATLAHSYILIGSKIETARVIFTMAESHDHDSPMRQLTEEEVADLKRDLGLILDECIELEMPISQRLLRNYRNDLPRTKRELDMLIHVVMGELEDRHFLYVPSHRAAYYKGETTFAAEILTAFPGIIEDLSEGSKCLAVERYTASVYHLMRAVEAAVQQIANKIHATVVDANGKSLAWGVIAANLKDVIDKMPKGTAAQIDAQIEWYRVHALLETLNRAWRVPTAHPKQTYTEDEAIIVLGAVKSFLSQIAPLA